MDNSADSGGEHADVCFIRKDCLLDGCSCCGGFRLAGSSQLQRHRELPATLARSQGSRRREFRGRHPDNARRSAPDSTPQDLDCW